MTDRFEVEIATDIAEEYLLGALIMQADISSVKTVKRIITHLDFQGCFQNAHPANWPRHARVFYAITLCDRPPHEINVALKMDELGILDKNDCAHLVRFVRVTPCALDYMDYANAVKQYSVQRQVKYHAGAGNYQKLNQLTQSVKYTGGVEGL